MDLQEYLAEAGRVEREGSTALAEAANTDALETARIAVLGDRHGSVKALQESLKSIAKTDKPAAGKRFNEVRTTLEALHA